MCTRYACKLVYVHSHCIIIHDKKAVHTVIMLQYYISWEIWEYTKSSLYLLYMLKNLNWKTYLKLTYSFQLSGKNLRKRFFNLPGLLYYIMCELLLVWLYMNYNAWYHTCQGKVVFDWIFRKTKIGLPYVFYIIPILKEISIHFTESL